MKKILLILTFLAIFLVGCSGTTNTTYNEITDTSALEDVLFKNFTERTLSVCVW